MTVTFGKRAARIAPPESRPPSASDPDGVTRVIPRAMWDGPHGATLRAHDASPDDTANLVLTAELMRSLELAKLEKMQGFVAKVNAHIPGVAVVPWAIIPWVVWKDRNAAFLMKAEFFPSSPWNNLFLAADARSSAYLGLPEHPRAPVSALDDNVTRLIDELRVELDHEIESILTSMSRGDFTKLSRYKALRKDSFQKLFALTRHVATLIWGDAVCARHDELFGIGLKGVTG